MEVHGGASGVVLRVRRPSAHGGALPPPSGDDRRCILYTSHIQSPHRVVQIQARQHKCFACLRPSADDCGVRLSRGLQAALYDDYDIEPRAEQSEETELFVTGVEEVAASAKPATCACEPGIVGAAEVHFMDRASPPRAVVNGLKHVVLKVYVNALFVSYCCKARRSGKTSAYRSTGSIVLRPRDFLVSSGRDKVRGAVLRWNEEVGGTHMTSRQQRTFQTMPEYAAKLSQQLGGLGEYAQRLLHAILARFAAVDPAPAAQQSTSCVAPTVGAILSGLPGVGKTLLAKTLCECLGVEAVFLNAADIFQTYVGQSEAQLVRTLEAATQQAPSILVIDGIESISASRAASQDSQSALEIGVLGAFVSCLDKLKLSRQQVFVLGTTSHLDAMDPAVFSNGRLDLIVRMQPPGQRERLEILEKLTKSWKVEDHSFLTRVSESTGGFVGADLLSLCQKALQVCLNRSASSGTTSTGIVVESSHFEAALATTYPSVLQTHHVSQRQKQPASTSIQSGDDEIAAFAGVYGMETALQAIRVSLLEPLVDCSRYLAFGTVPPKGILLTGAPGSGKSHLADAVAREVRRRGLASFVSVNCADLLTKVVGDTERALRELFTTARSAAPCVLYFDHIESIAPRRGFDTSTEQTFDRMLSMLLVEMDGFHNHPVRRGSNNDSEGEAKQAFLKHHVVVLASTTRKDALDPAILRPGRFDVHIDVGFPDAAARKAIVLDTLKSIPLDYTQDPQLPDAHAVAAFAVTHTSGMSAGDVRALFRDAAMAAMRERMDVAKRNRCLDPRTNAQMRGEKRRPTPHLGAQLHARNRYKDNAPDFYQLATLYPSFKRYVRNVDDEKQTASLAWSDPFAVRELTKTLLLHDFQLHWSLPIDRLCPPLPNRLNYLHWIEDLLLETNIAALLPSETSIYGIDIGTGASCIYALLGAQMHPNWRFLATETNAESFASAQENVRRNPALETRVNVLHVHTQRLLREPLEQLEPAFGDANSGDVVHFCMCNPPFFDDMSEADTNPSTCCMGSSNEMVCPGGEVAFITNMIDDSLALRHRVVWYTSMIGKKSTVRKILAVLREKQIPQTRTTEFLQGRTKRWGIAWTFRADVASGDASSKVLGKRKEAHRKNEIVFTVPYCSESDDSNGCTSVQEVSQRVQEFVASHPALALDPDAESGDEDASADLYEVENHDYVFYRLQGADDAASNFTSAFDGRIEITKRTRDEETQEEVENDFEVIVTFESGARSAFWKTADALKAATVRLGRQWRRKKRNHKEPTTAT
ncbi:Cell division cycle protein, partial [Globisporangium splendens]